MRIKLSWTRRVTIYSAKPSLSIGNKVARPPHGLTYDRYAAILAPDPSSQAPTRSRTAAPLVAGLYIGQSSNVSMRRNRVFGNVVGIEASNSSDVKLLANEAWYHTNGILAVLLPAADQDRPRHADLREQDPRQQPAQRRGGRNRGRGARGPQDSGCGADRVTAGDNTVTGNSFIGIGVGCSLGRAARGGRARGLARAFPACFPVLVSARWPRARTQARNGAATSSRAIAATSRLNGWSG